MPNIVLEDLSMGGYIKLYSAHRDVYMYDMFLYSLFGDTAPWTNYMDNHQVGTFVTKVIRSDYPR